MGSGSKKLITKKQADELSQMASTDPKAAMAKLHETVMIRAGIDRAQKFSIDAIGRTAKRRTPLRITGSLDQEFSGDPQRKELIATGRDLFLNFSFAKGILRQHVKNMIGRGPRLQMTTDDDEYNKRAEDYWERRKNLINVRGMPFAQSLRVGESVTVVDGDYGEVIIKGGQTQFIESDRIADPPQKKKVRGRKYVGGVEMNRAGTPVAYHIWNRGSRPGKMNYNRRVLAENFFHNFSPERFDQTRGLSWITAAVNDLQDLRETLEAAKGKWKIENMLGVAIKSDMPESNELASLWGGMTDYTGTDADGNDETKYEVKLGQGVHSFELRPGESIETIESKTPNNTFEPMTLLLIRIVALTLEMPIEIALQYFTRGGYSSHRAAFNQYNDAVMTRRADIEETYLDRKAGWVLRRAIKRGGLEGPDPEKVKDPTRHEWQWPGMGILDPDKQRKGDKEGYALAVESLSTISGRDGNFWQDLAMQRINEIKWITKAATDAGVDPAQVLPAVLMPGQSAPGATPSTPPGA